MVLKGITYSCERTFSCIFFGSDKFISYIFKSKVKVHMDHEGLKEIIPRKDVKTILFHWNFLLQEFDLRIVERSQV
jgi:hypothetical protein